MELILVDNGDLAKEFIETGARLNAKTPQYIRPLNKDIEQVFDPKKNKAFRHGTCARWLLKNKEGEYIGRIAAFVNKKYRTKGDRWPVGGIGFFDCINDQAAADQLFDVSRHWLLQQGVKAMDGPINFGERDRWWGLVVEGFQEPLYGMNFNPPYYQSLFENYGFKPFFHQVCFGLDPKKPLAEKIIRRHREVAANPDFTARTIEKSKLRKYAEDFSAVYNAAWAGHGGMKQMKADQAYRLFQSMKLVMDERIVWFAYYRDQPIAIFINLPDLNQWFKHLNGKFGWWEKLRFIWMRYTKPCRKFTGIVFGVIPEFQGKGIDAFIITEAAKLVQPHTPYLAYELQWIGDFNPKMLNVAGSLGDTYPSRKLITFRYQFDRTEPFERHPIF